MTKFENISRLSLNQITTERWNLQEAVDGCIRNNVPSIAIWRHKVKDLGLSACKKIVRDSGIQVSSLCRGGMFPAATAIERKERIEDNLRAIDEAVELGTNVLVLVCGPASDKDIVEARKQVEEGIQEILPYAKSAGVKLGIEPLHPMYAAERSVIVTLGQANSMVEKINNDHLGVIVDVYHVWWDPQLYEQINRAKGRILGFHVSDWTVPTTDLLMSRGMMGDGVIELRRIRDAVDQTGYDGPIEVEIFNREIWDMQGDDVLALMKERYLEHC
ncbi:sugar phosphate isomerase/epimerase [Evansella sp. AB-P1]|uniref:sugar phosphate isomerase/epimerase family protein n=1 Tax=Evansella sp. AB-P1 TaxID=3037653 RepID=UPI00241F8DFC|nr:sugar phosphate isomerase/epimerase family protein [Evansella sp. AB-P1]MDG5787917.1 sugar phosphate isomerase/epimerase [Evansella sp. AB-P1]